MLGVYIDIWPVDTDIEVNHLVQQQHSIYEKIMAKRFETKRLKTKYWLESFGPEVSFVTKELLGNSASTVETKYTFPLRPESFIHSKQGSGKAVLKSDFFNTIYVQKQKRCFVSLE